MQHVGLLLEGYMLEVDQNISRHSAANAFLAMEQKPERNEGIEQSISAPIAIGLELTSLLKK